VPELAFVCGVITLLFFLARSEFRATFGDHDKVCLGYLWAQSRIRPVRNRMASDARLAVPATSHRIA